MIVLTGIFMGLVYGYLVSEDPLASHEDDVFGARPDSSDRAAYYYVNYSATRLITVSSWTSTVTSFTSTFVMALVSYPVAKAYLNHSEVGTADELPTPYQFRLIIGLLGGSLGSLWSWMDYSLWRKRTRQTKLLWMTATALLASIFLRYVQCHVSGLWHTPSRTRLLSKSGMSTDVKNFAFRLASQSSQSTHGCTSRHRPSPTTRYRASPVIPAPRTVESSTPTAGT